MNLATYTLQVFSPEWAVVGGGVPTFTQLDKRVLSNLPAMVESIEEDFTDLLPEGYEVKIVQAME